MQKINHIFSLKQWEQVQDSLSDLTGMAVLMVDYRGVPVTKHSHWCRSCAGKSSVYIPMLFWAD